MTRATLADLIADQRKWIEKAGGDLAGYVAHYGSENDPDHYGHGGEAIYAADTEELRRLEAKQRRPHSRRTAAAVALVLCALSAPVVAQPAPPVYTFGSLTSPNMVPPMFYSGLTPFGMFYGTTTGSHDLRIYNTYGPDGTMTTCTQSASGFVNCFGP